MRQVRSCVSEYAILPLGSPYVKSNSPVINSLLLYGPPGAGKTHLSRAIACQAVCCRTYAAALSRRGGVSVLSVFFFFFDILSGAQGAFWFDLSASRLEGLEKALVSRLVRTRAHATRSRTLVS